MNTTAAIFFLVLGQANGSVDTIRASGGLTVIPAHYESAVACEQAGEEARRLNLGLSFLSYTCVPASVNVVEPARVRATSLTPHTVSFSARPKAPRPSPGPKCDEVCELIEVEGHD